GKFTFPADFVIVDYESDPRVPLILGRPFLRTARALIDVHGEKMILRDGDERLTLNMRHDTSSYSNQPQKESINLINVFNDSSEDFLEDLFSNQPSGNPTFSSHPELTSPKVEDDIFDLERGNVLPEKLLDLDSTKDLHPPLHVNPLSGSTIYSSSHNPLLEELADELALITFPSKYDDDDLQFDVESDLKEIEFLLHQDIDSSLKDSIDQSNLVDLADNFADSMPEMFTDKHALDYSSPSIFDEYDDDFLEGEKIKESKLLIDKLDLPCDFLPSEYDSFISQDFSKVDTKPSTNNEDMVFNLGKTITILILEIRFVEQGLQTGIALVWDVGWMNENEPDVKASRAKRTARNHDPLALVANTYASPSYSRPSQSYYVTHPPSNTTGNIENVQSRIYKALLILGKHQQEQMLIATKDEAGIHLDDEENDFMLMSATRDDQLEKLNASMIMMA
nr:hypothetical protein [Tanacetum cinerariifolium]